MMVRHDKVRPNGRKLRRTRGPQGSGVGSSEELGGREL